MKEWDVRLSRSATKQYVKLEKSGAKRPSIVEHSFLIRIRKGNKEERTPWEECTPWEEVAAARIAKYTKAGIALRGARYRESLSQKQLAALCGISQDNISKMECGKRPIGPQVASRLAEALYINPKLLLQP